jgi:hypothetical protein
MGWVLSVLTIRLEGVKICKGLTHSSASKALSQSSMKSLKVTAKQKEPDRVMF